MRGEEGEGRGVGEMRFVGSNVCALPDFLLLCSSSGYTS